MIKYIEQTPSAEEFNYLTNKEPFYEKFGFISRPNEDLGAGMILY